MNQAPTPGAERPLCTRRSWLALLADHFVAPPLPPLSPMGGCALTQSFRSLALSRAVLVVRCAAGPLRASPASASLLRELFDSDHSKQTVPNFCVRYSVRSFLAQ
jgi:hypothetical protein